MQENESYSTYFEKISTIVISHIYQNCLFRAFRCFIFLFEISFSRKSLTERKNINLPCYKTSLPILR